MVEGLHNLAINDINPAEDFRGNPFIPKLYMSTTGASTTWRDKKPHFFTGFYIEGEEPVVKRFDLNQNLASYPSMERNFNI